MRSGAVGGGEQRSESKRLPKEPLAKRTADTALLCALGLIILRGQRDHVLLGPSQVAILSVGGYQLPAGSRLCPEIDGVRFYTRAKTVTKHWYDEVSRVKVMDTWEGTVERI